MKEPYRNYYNSYSTYLLQFLFVLTLTAATLVFIMVFKGETHSGLIMAVSVGVVLLGIIIWALTNILKQLKLAKRELSDTRQHLEERVHQRRIEQEKLVKELKNEIDVRREVEDVLTSLRKKEDIRQRKILAGELHDIIGQNLQTIKLLFMTQQAEMQQGNLPDLDNQKQIVDEVETAIKHLRQMTNELHPIFLENMDILEAIQSHNGMIFERVGLNITLENDSEHYNLEDMIKEYCFLIYREALNNIIKHAEATQVRIKLKQLQTKWVQIEIIDNGKGFDLDLIEDRGHGLVLIQDRTRDIGGSVDINSVPGEGTCVYIKVPSND